MVKIVRAKLIWIKFVSLVVLCALFLVACGSESNDEVGSRVDTSPENTIVTSFYPIEFVASQIADEDFNVVNVTPLGAPAHDLELTPEATQDVLESKLAIVLGEGFQPAIEETASQRDGSTVVLMDSIEENHSDEEKTVDDHSEEGEDDHGHDGEDPHIWLDPVLMSEVVDVVAAEIVEISGDNKYLENAEELKENLNELHVAYEDSLRNCELDTFVTSHYAFSRLAERYELNQEPIRGFSPENEPSPERMAEIVELVEDKGIDTIFSEELVSQKVADSLSSEAGVNVKILAPLESLTEQQLEDGEDYFSIMNSNLAGLQSALKCGTV